MVDGDQVIEFRGEATADPHHLKPCLEKPLRMLSDPYRKPTQVGGMSIPRRKSEPWLRNSAN